MNALSTRNLPLNTNFFSSKSKKSIMTNDEKLIQKMEPFPCSSYYDVLPAKPGIDFYKWFVDTDTRYNDMQINIPRTYFRSQYPYIMYTNEQGSISVEDCSSIKLFSTEVVQNKKRNSKHIVIPKFMVGDPNIEEKMVTFEKEIPIALMKINSGEHCCKYQTQIMDYASFNEKINGISIGDGMVIQEFIYPPGDYANLIRYIYYSNSAIPLKVFILVVTSSIHSMQ